MPRGRKPVPTQLKILKGTQKCRINGDEPKPAPGRPQIPANLKGDPDAVTGWNQIVDAVESLGILSKVDSLSLATYASVYARWADATRQVKKDGLTFLNDKNVLRKHPLVETIRDCEALMLRIQIEYGLTASSRSKIHAPKAEADDLEDFLADLG